MKAKDYTLTTKPVPPENARGRKPKYPWGELKVGDRFFTNRNVAKLAKDASKNGRKFKCYIRLGFYWVERTK